MILAADRTELAEDLRRMMDELCAPELTLTQAEVLRPRVHRLLDALREANEPARPVGKPDRPGAGPARRNR